MQETRNHLRLEGTDLCRIGFQGQSFLEARSQGFAVLTPPAPLVPLGRKGDQTLSRSLVLDLVEAQQDIQLKASDTVATGLLPTDLRPVTVDGDRRLLR